MKISYVYLDAIAYNDAARYTALLTPARRAKINRFRFDRDKLLSLAAGLLIRREAGEGPFVCNANGKPYLSDGGLFFSVSHSGTCAAIVTDTAEIGLDVEKLPERDYMKFARRFYHPEELNCVKSADDPARAFTRIWTRKEAYLKQLGIGIATDLRAFNTVSGELSDRIASFDLEGYALSVCAADKILTENIRITELQFNDLIND